MSKNNRLSIIANIADGQLLAVPLFSIYIFGQIIHQPEEMIDRIWQICFNSPGALNLWSQGLSSAHQLPGAKRKMQPTEQGKLRQPKAFTISASCTKNPLLSGNTEQAAEHQGWDVFLLRSEREKKRKTKTVSCQAGWGSQRLIFRGEEGELHDLAQMCVPLHGAWKQTSVPDAVSKQGA